MSVNPKIAVVTTFHKAGLDLYGQRCIDTFEEFWPGEIDLYLYAENCEPRTRRGKIVDLIKSCPALTEFKQRNQHREVTNFRFDGVRFSHKVFAWVHCARNCGADKLFWIDADTRTFRHIPFHVVNSWMPDHCYTAGLLRTKPYTETGFIGFNLKHPANDEFMQRCEDHYVHDLVYRLPGYTDSYVYDAVKNKMSKQGKITVHNLSGKYMNHSHPFVNCELGQYMDHMKGFERKRKGTSHKSDLVVRRDEEYWKGV